MPISLMLPSTIRRVGRQERTSDSAVVVLPQPDSPAMPERLAVVEAEADAVDRLDRPGLEREVRPQVLDDEQRRGRVGLLRQRPLPAASGPHRGRPRAARPGRAPERVALGDRSVVASSSGRCRRVRSAGRRRTAGRSSSARRRGLRISSRASPTSVNASTTRTMQSPGGTMYHHAPRPGAPASCGRVEDLAPRRRERVAEADERERRLGQDRAREDEDGVGDDEVDDVRQDVAPHDVRGRRADDPGPVDEHPLLHATASATG